MDLSTLLCAPTLLVYESGNLWRYKMKRTKDGFPFYVSPQEKLAMHKTALFDDILFLPITTKEYETGTHLTKSYWGFRYIIGSCGVTKMVVQEDPNEIDEDHPGSLSQFRIGFEASRIRYFIDDDKDCDIMIDFMGDSMFPTRIVNFSGTNTEVIAQTIDEVIVRLVNDHCHWYVNKVI